MFSRRAAALAAACLLSWVPAGAVADPQVVPQVVEAPSLAPPPVVESKPLPSLTDTKPDLDIRRRVIKIDGLATAKLYKNNLYSVSIEGVDAKRLEEEIEAGNLACDWVIETDRADRYDLVPTVRQDQLLFTAEPGKYRIWLTVAQLKPFRNRTAYLDVTFPGAVPPGPYVPPDNVAFTDVEEMVIGKIGGLVQLPVEQKKMDCVRIAAVYSDAASKIGSPGFATVEEFIPVIRGQINAVLTAGSDRTAAWRAVRESIAQRALELEKEQKLITVPQYKSFYSAVSRAFAKAGG